MNKQLIVTKLSRNARHTKHRNTGDRKRLAKCGQVERGNKGTSEEQGQG